MGGIWIAEIGGDFYLDLLAVAQLAAQPNLMRAFALEFPGENERPPDEEIARYRANLVEVAEGSGAAWVDANDALASVPASDLDPYFIDPVHPSAKGHAAIAQALAPALVEALAR